MKIRNKSHRRANPNRNIPIELTSFIGRKRELVDVKELLSAHRLVTLTGTGGCGKTRIALRLGSELRENYTDDINWVELASLADGALLAQTIAKALQIPHDARRSSSEVLVEALREKQSLLILDNCEHMLDACAEMVQVFLSETEVNILATSREALQITGETVYPLQPMSVPLDDRQDISQYDAVGLFIERAKSILPTFELTENNAASIVNICKRLDGIPLAIELASAHTNILSVDQIVDRLDKRFQIFPNNSYLIDSPHSGLRAAFDWSYNLLSPSEQILLRRLSVFQGGCSISTVEKVCTGNGIEQYEVLELVSSLVNKSLLVAQTLQRREARYVLLETIRQHAQEKLIASGEWLVQRDRHLQCFLEITEEVELKLRGEYQELWLNWLESEYDNIRAALKWALESNSTDAGLRIATALNLFWVVRAYVDDGRTWMAQLLDLADERVTPVIHANALAYASFLAGFRGNGESQTTYGRKARALAEVLGAEGQSALVWVHAGEAYAHGRPGPLPSGESPLTWALGAQAYGARAVGDYESEFAIYKKIIQLHRASGMRFDLGMSLITCGFAAMSLGKYDEARAMTDEGLLLLREAGNLYPIAMSLNGSGDLARCQQNYALANTHYEESIAMLRQLGAVRDLASSLHNLGHTCVHLGDVERAYSLFSESLALHQDQKNTPGIAECLIGFAAIATVNKMSPASARLLAAAVAIGGEGVATSWPATKMEYDHYLTLVRASLTEMDFETEQATGRTFSIEQAVTYALSVGRKALFTQKSHRKLDDLTPREREIATLIGQAMSNAEIADELVLSKRTVETHVSNIRSKLNFTKRAQIVQWAIENNLVDTSG